jgi:flagellar hook-associated protein 2
MSEISFGGLATGLPTEDIIKGLMSVERRPLDQLERRRDNETARLNAFAEFNSKLDDLRSAVSDMNLTSQVRTSSARVSDSAPFSASASSAATGSYDVAVAQLAQVQKSVSGGFASERAAVLGTGTLTLGDVTIEIDAGNNSLQGLAAAINERSGDTGVQATILNDGSADAPYRLVMTGADANTSFTPQFNLTDGGGGAIDPAMEQVRSAQQAVAYVDGIKVVGDSNTLTGVIPGVTLNLDQVSEMTYAGTPEAGVNPSDWADPPQYQSHVLNVEADTGALKEKVQNFVDSYNAVMDWISSGYPEFGAPTTTAGEDGEEAQESLAMVLRGDSSINSVKRTLQGVLSTSVNNSGDLSVLSQLGISTNRDGSLSLNSAMLDKQLAENFDDVGKLLAGDDQTEGVMKKFNSALLDLTSPTRGLYAAKKDRHDAAVRRLDQQILDTEARLQKREEALRARFSAMELLVSGMNSQSSFLSQQMDMLSNMMTGNK